MKCYGVRLLRHVFADYPHPRHIRILLEGLRILTSPCTRVNECRRERQPKRNRLHLEPACETTPGIQHRLVLDDSRHHRAAAEMNRLLENADHRARGMAHVVLSDLA